MARDEQGSDREPPLWKNRSFSPYRARDQDREDQASNRRRPRSPSSSRRGSHDVEDDDDYSSNGGGRRFLGKTSQGESKVIFDGMGRIWTVLKVEEATENMRKNPAAFYVMGEDLLWQMSGTNCKLDLKRFHLHVGVLVSKAES